MLNTKRVAIYSLYYKDNKGQIQMIDITAYSAADALTQFDVSFKGQELEVIKIEPASR